MPSLSIPIFMTLLVLAAPSAAQQRNELADGVPARILPFEGPGKLALIVSIGRRDRDRHLEDQHVLVVTPSGTRRVDLVGANRVRWISPDELIVSQSVPQSDRGMAKSRIVRVDKTGELSEWSSAEENLAGPEPSPDGQRVAVARFTGGSSRREIRGLTKPFEPQLRFPKDFGELTDIFTTFSVWAPSGEALVIGIGVREPRGIITRLALLSAHEPSLTRLPDASAGHEPDPGGVMPLFWIARGIYAKSKSKAGLLHCDPKGGGCNPVYHPGPGRSVILGTKVGEDKALLVVRDQSRDPREIRAKQIHEVDLVSGQGRVLVDLPGDLFVEGIDWVGDRG